MTHDSIKKSSVLSSRYEDVSSTSDSGNYLTLGGSRGLKMTQISFCKQRDVQWTSTRHFGENKTLVDN